MLSSRASVVEKKVMGALAFMVDGSMCCAVSDAGLLVRVTPEERDALLAAAHVSPMTVGTRTMRGFVRVGPAAIRTDAALRVWLERGIAAGRGRKARPKPGRTASPKPVARATARRQR